jgi:hypothetical protein
MKLYSTLATLAVALSPTATLADHTKSDAPGPRMQPFWP